MANINDSFLVNLSQSVGISYDLKKNVLGSTTSPNSALFNVSQIASILTYGKPVFGVFEDADSFANMDFVNNIEADKIKHNLICHLKQCQQSQKLTNFHKLFRLIY